MPHPAITMSQRRAEAWKKEAEDEDFFKYLQSLAHIYSARKYRKGIDVRSDNMLFVEFKGWQDKQKDDIIQGSAEK
jgi:hypothetical protein